MSKFSDMLVYLRKRDNISQQELADRIGMSRSIVGMYETGKRMPSFEVLEAIADVFNVDINFLYGHTDSREYSQIYRSNLAAIVENANRADLEAAGVDLYEVGLIIDGAISLSFDHACHLANQLGETLDSMLGIKKPAIEHDDELSSAVEIFKKLSPDNRSKLLELGRLYLDAQHNS